MYQALSNRDFDKSLKYSLRLLGPGQIKASSDNHYPLMVAMTSGIVLNKNKEARDLSHRYENKVALPLDIRFLHAIAVNEDH